MHISNSKTSTLILIGHFAAGKESANGQTVKTVMLMRILRQQLGESAVHTVDTCGGLRVWLKLFFRTGKAIKNFDNIIMLPAQRGLQVFAPLFIFYNSFFHHKLHYVVIGGWLPGMTKRKKWLAYFLKKFDGIYVETSSMKSALEEQGFTNVFVMPNFKDLPILTEKELVYTIQEPFAFCTFSRVMQEKGIEDAVEAVTQLNTQTGRIVATLDIYGKIDDNYAEHFEKLQQTFPSYICYKGVVAPDQSVNVLKNYFALLFPTYYAGEGFAGTLLDALAAGIPVIATDWKYNAEIVKGGKTGIVIRSSLLEEIKEAISHLQSFNAMKPSCLKEAQKYTPQKAILPLLERIL